MCLARPSILEHIGVFSENGMRGLFNVSEEISFNMDVEGQCAMRSRSSVSNIFSDYPFLNTNSLVLPLDPQYKDKTGLYKADSYVAAASIAITG